MVFLVRLMDFKTVERQFDAPDIKMKAMFNLLNYYKEMGRDENVHKVIVFNLFST